MLYHNVYLSYLYLVIFRGSILGLLSLEGKVLTNFFIHNSFFSQSSHIKLDIRHNVNIDIQKQSFDSSLSLFFHISFMTQLLPFFSIAP